MQNSKGCSATSKERESKVCPALSLGCIVAYLEGSERRMIWSNESPSYTGSVDHLVDRIKSIRVRGDLLRTGKSLYDGPVDHKGCNPLGKVLQEVDQLVASMVSPVTYQHQMYLMAQRQKTGLKECPTYIH